MFLIVLLDKAFNYIIRLPYFLLFILKDLFFYIKDKKWQIFDKWGLHVYIGSFGACKTSSMVYDAYRLAKQYKQLTIVTNLKLNNFPKYTTILPLRTVNDILNAPDNTLVLIDEIGTIFNSRDFKSNNALPKILFQHICQCRHRHLMIYGTVQRWNFLDKQLRDICATVRKCHGWIFHPFIRYMSYTVYDAFEYNRAFENVSYPLSPIRASVHVQTDKIRKLYSTEEMVSTLIHMEYDSDSEILANRGEYTGDIGAPLDRKQKRQVKKSSKAIV